MNIEFVTYWDIMFISKFDFDGLITRKFPMHNTEKKAYNIKRHFVLEQHKL